MFPQTEDIITSEERRALIQEIDSSARPPSSARVRLPERKGATPRLVCLDMKDWIYLGRAKYGLDDNEACCTALDLLEAAIAAQRIVAPITSANVLEVAEVADTSKRERLAQFMVGLSRNHFLLDHLAVQERELYDAVVLCYLGHAAHDLPPLRSRLVRWGIGSAAGVTQVVCPGATPHEQAVMNELHRHPMLSARVLGRMVSKDAMASGRAIDERWRRAEEQVREGTGHLTDEERLDVECVHRLMGGQGARLLRNVAARLSIPWEELSCWLQDGRNRVDLMKNVASLDVELQLRTARGRNLQQRTARNDLKDLVFLSSTIPHADIIVTEKMWGHFVVATRLNERYSTTVCRNVGELVPLLGDESG